MKKLLYILLISILGAVSFTACTEEDVTPSTELNGGGAGIDPK